MYGNTKKLIEMDAETREYQEISAKIKFKQNLIQGIGVATVFGIIGAAGHELFNLAMGKGVVAAVTAPAAASATAAAAAPIAAAAAPAAAVATGLAAALPWLAIGAIVVAGIGCLYYASKYYAESVRLDQNYQAKQIADGVNGPVKTIGTGPIHYPDQAATVAETTNSLNVTEAMNPATPQVSNVSLDDKVIPITSLEKARA